MKIKNMKITNFRGYKGTVSVDFDNLTVFVGKNDIGKSTILEALDIFFNDGKGIIKPEKTDINVDALLEGVDEFIIEVGFVEFPKEIVIDSESKTSLEDEYLLTSDRKFTVVKKYKNGTTSKIYIKANHPSNPEYENLLIKKNADLKSIVHDKKIPCENLSINHCLRRSIWNSLGNNLNLQELELDVSSKDGDLKNIWKEISSFLPVYSLFQSDRKNTDGDDEIQDPLQEAVKQILGDVDIQSQLQSVASTVEKRLKSVSDATLEKLREMDTAIADSLNPVIPSSDSLQWSSVFKKLSITGDQNIPINKRGSGVKRLILLNFFRAEAEKRVSKGTETGIIYAIEEPETSQHTANQKILIEALKRISQGTNSQVIITSHSPFIVKQLSYDNLRWIAMQNKQRTVQSVDTSVFSYLSLNEINYLAFEECSEEYLNEMYALMKEKQWWNDYCKGKSKLKYTKTDENGREKEEYHILEEYIRHQFHHPENHKNTHYTNEQLSVAIRNMRAYILKKTKDEHAQIII